MMRRGAGLDPDQARRHLPKERHNIPALQLPPDNDLASRIDAMDLKDRFRNIETDRRDRFHAPLPVSRDRSNGDRFTGTYVPAGEPSTASKWDGLTPVCQSSATGSLTRRLPPPVRAASVSAI